MSKFIIQVGVRYNIELYGFYSITVNYTWTKIAPSQPVRTEEYSRQNKWRLVQFQLNDVLSIVLHTSDIGLVKMSDHPFSKQVIIQLVDGIHKSLT